MPNLSYDDQQFNMIERALLCNVPALCVSQTTWVTRWYPKGPIRIKKFGIITTVESTGSEFTVTLADSAGSELATIVCSTTQAVGLASKALTGLTADLIIAGDYITVTADGTSDAGSMMPFIDYTRVYADNHAI